MQVSAAGLAAIEAREGKRLKSYQDSVGIWTIGVGHTGRMAGAPVTPGMAITPEQCDAFLAADLAPVEAAINGLGVHLTQNQFDACASLAFNIGVHGFVGSSVVRQLKAGNLQLAADDFLMWEKPPELRGRREAERKQFLTPDLDKPVAPAAAAPASPSAAAKAPATMTSASTSALAAAHPNVAAALPGVDFFQGIVNFGEHIVGSLGAGAAAIVNPAIEHITGQSDATIPGQPSGSGFFGTLENVRGAAGKIGQIVADAKAGDVREAIADGVDLLKLIFATLDVFHVDVPVLGTVVESLGSLHAGADKPA